ncbi:tetratricopeptide repeat protein [Micromonospora sp. DT229]|uniref:fibronectin type III domain-containing protein n=1 Tax=Micromonospora sp. DT229 TaxID=3393430 RepID=UPI003CFA44D5
MAAVPGSMGHVPHASPLAITQQRALALRGAGNLAAARDLLSDAFESARPPFGKDHPDVLSTAHLLARLHREADDPSAARRVLEEAFAAGERRWPTSDPLMLALSYELGSVAAELGNRHEARRNYLRVATAGPAVLGVDHPAVRAAREYLGDAAPALAPAVPPAGQPSAVGPAPHDALAEPTMSLAVLSTAWQPHDAATATAPLRPVTPDVPAVPPVPVVSPPAPTVPPVPSPSPRVVPPVTSAPPVSSAPRVSAPPAPVRPAPTVPLVPAPRTGYHDEPTRPFVPVPALPEAGAPAEGSSAAGSRTAPLPGAVEDTEAIGRPTTSLPTDPVQQGVDRPAGPATPQWANPTIAVQQIGPLLAEEAARRGPGEQVRTPGVHASSPTSGPPSAGSPTSAAPASATPVSAPPDSGPPVSGPPNNAAPVSAPPSSGPPDSAASVSAPPSAPTVDLSRPQSPRHQVPGFGGAGGSAPGGPPAHELTAALPQPGPTSGPPGRVPFPFGTAGAQPDQHGMITPSGPGPVDGPSPYGPTGGARHGYPVSSPPGSPLGDGQQQYPGSAYPPEPAPSAYPQHPPAAQAYPPPTQQTHPTPAQQQAYSPPAQQAGPPPGQHTYPPPGQQAYPPASPSAAPGQPGAYPTAQAYPPPVSGGPAHSGGWGQQPAQPGYQGEPARGRSRAAVVVAVIAVVVALAAVIGVGLMLLDRWSGATPTTPTSSGQPQGGAPPTQLVLRDDTATITLTWTDPADGLVPFMVAGGRSGQPLGVMATVSPGETRYTVNGLNSRVDYCFTVLAVYGTDQFATSGQVCTSRKSDGPAD